MLSFADHTVSAETVRMTNHYSHEEGRIMTLKVRNLSQHPVSLTGNSGQCWHLPPLRAVDLPEFEVANNAKVVKLLDQRLIEVKDVSPEQTGESKERGRRIRPGN